MCTKCVRLCVDHYIDVMKNGQNLIKHLNCNCVLRWLGHLLLSDFMSFINMMLSGPCSGQGVEFQIIWLCTEEQPTKEALCHPGPKMGKKRNHFQVWNSIWQTKENINNTFNAYKTVALYTPAINTLYIDSNWICFSWITIYTLHSNPNLNTQNT